MISNEKQLFIIAGYKVRLKAHPNVPNANLSNLKDFPNSDVPGLV